MLFLTPCCWLAGAISQEYRFADLNPRLDVLLSTLNVYVRNIMEEKEFLAKSPRLSNAGRGQFVD